METTRIGELVIELQAKTKDLETGLSIAKKKLQEIEKQNEEVKKSNKNIEGSYLAMSAVAVASLVKVGSAIKEAVNEYNKYTQAMSSLKDVANYAGSSMSEFSDIMSEFSTYMTQDDLAATIKNFTLMGMTAKQTKQMIEALTNSAIKNRNANYTVSQAVKVASDGYKQGLSTLSDSAGVTENLSVMLDNYAKSIGKTASQLSEEEKNLAYLNRTMEASAPFAGAMAEYMDTLAGKQGAYNQAIRETQVAYAEALEPMLSDYTSLMSGLMNEITAFVKEHPALVEGVTTAGIAFGISTVAVIAYRKAKDALTKSTLLATAAEKGFTAALKANPIIAAVSTITLVIGAITTLISAVKRNQEEQEKLNQINNRANEISQGTYKYTSEHAKQVEEDTANIKKQLDIENRLNEIREQASQDFIQRRKLHKREMTATEKEYWDLIEKQKEAKKENGEYGESIEKLNEQLEHNEEWLRKNNDIMNASTILDYKAAKAEKEKASQIVMTAREHRKYLEIVKNGTEGTEEYENAVEALAKAFPLAVSANGPIKDELETLISTEERAAESEYDLAQSTIENNRKIIGSWSEMSQNLDSDANREHIEGLANQLNIPIDKINDELIPVLKEAIAYYGVVEGKTPEDMGGTYTKSTTKSNNTSTSYQNKALDDYKKQIDYKKNLDKISTEEEIQMYEYALKNLAKINDEKMDLEVEIYKLRKQLVENYIDDEKELLDQRTEESERWIEEQNLSAREQEAAYDRIIAYHKEYLDKMMADERLSLEQKDKIWREEVNTIKDYQKQIRDIRIESANNVYEALKDALISQADKLQEIEEDAINNSLNALEKAKNKRLEAIKEEYDARIKAIDDELKALEEAEETKSRLEEDEDYEKKKKRLEELIAYEHDAVTRASYEKELAKLNAEYQKTLDKRELDDKKSALNDEKDRLKEEQQARTDSITAKYEKEKDYLDNRLDAIQKNYDKEREMADKNAQVMLLNTEKYQDQIITLLKTYGDEYELLGKTWGEKVVDAFQDKIQGIVETVEKLNQQIDNAITAKIKEMSGGITSAEIAQKKAYSSSNADAIAAISKDKGVDLSVAESMYRNGVTVIQNNTYTVEVERPSTMQQKQKHSLEQLGELVRGSA